MSRVREAPRADDADVASLVVKCVLKDAANGKTLSAVDKEQLFDQPAFEEFAL